MRQKRIHKYCTMFFLLTVTMVGCTPSEPTKTTTPTTSDEVAPKVEAPHKDDIGDIEAMLKIDAVLADKSKADNTKVEPLVNLKNQLDMETVTVHSPFPSELWASIVVHATNGFVLAPVLLRVKIMRDKEELVTVAAVLGADAAMKPYQYDFNMLQGMTGTPSSFLISAQAEVIMLPKGTDPAHVDPTTVKTTPETTGAILSNPIRVTFVSTETGA